jgi:hypothetical protein
MLEFRPIKIDDKNEFDRILKEKKYLSCEYCFSNFYIWKDVIHTECCITENVIHVRGRIKGETFYFMPIAKEGYMDKALEELLHTENRSLLIKCATDRNMKEASEAVLSKFIRVEDFDINDYMYNSADLIELMGKKYHQKRNHVNKFKSLFEYEFVELREEDTEACLELNELWMESKDELTIEMNNESLAIRNALRNYKDLGLIGAMIKIEGKIAAFTIGEIVHEELSIVHFEKCDISYNGIFPAINQAFAEYAFKNVKYINRQDDMGLPGLRKSKLSYHPVMMVEKYILKCGR